MGWRWTLARAWTAVAPLHRGGFRLARWARADFPRDQWVRRVRCLPGVTLDLNLGTYPDVCMATGIYELETRRWIGKLLPIGGHFVDVGANVGYFSLSAARRAGRVDAIEPDPVNRERLDRHIELNHPTNVTVHPFAAAARAGELLFYHPTDGMNHGQASRFVDLVPGGQAYSVAAGRLDSIVAGVPDVVKIDVEGSEFDAVRGAESWWRSTAPPALIVEHNPESGAAAGFKMSDLVRWLLNAQPRYRVGWIDWRVRPINDPSALDGEMRQGNLLFRATSKP